MRFRNPTRLTWLVAFLICTIIVAVVLSLTTGNIPYRSARALHHADQYELYSLFPIATSGGTKPQFHGHNILGQISITDPAVRERLNTALEAGAKDGNDAHLCFNPRHGIRVTRGGEVTDFVICFECHQVEIWRNQQRAGGFLTSGIPQAVFDEVLKKASVALNRQN